MTVITISREYASSGDEVAEQVARTLGYHLVDKAFISSLLSQYGLAEFDIEYEKQPGFWESFDVEKADRRAVMVRTLNRLVKMVARHGNVVILGRSGYAILSGLADVLHVRLQAPLDSRVERVRAEQSISLEAAVALVKERDKVRSSFIESFYRVPWNDVHAFDIAINTSIVPVGVATGWVIEAAKLLPSSAGNKPTTKGLEIDEVMMQTVAEKLKCLAEHA